MFNALAKRGHGGGAQDYDSKLSAHCVIGDMTLGLSFSIVGKYSSEMFRGTHRPARDLPASTPLQLSLDRRFRTEIRTTWRDDNDRKLEAQLADIAADIIVAGEASFRQSLVEAIEREEEHRKWEEERRLKHLASLKAQRLEDLKTSGKLLSNAEEIRRLVARVKSAMLTGDVDMTQGELARWESWALAYADRIDPVKSGQIFSHIRVPELD